MLIDMSFFYLQSMFLINSKYPCSIHAFFLDAFTPNFNSNPLNSLHTIIKILKGSKRLCKTMVIALMFINAYNMDMF